MGTDSESVPILLYIEYHLVSVKRHSVGLHAYLLLYLVDNCFVFLASFLSCALDKVEVACCICEDHVDEVDYELHVLLYETA